MLNEQVSLAMLEATRKAMQSDYVATIFGTPRSGYRGGRHYVYIDFPNSLTGGQPACWSLADGEPASGEEFEILAKARIREAMEDIYEIMQEHVGLIEPLPRLER